MDRERQILTGCPTFGHHAILNRAEEHERNDL